MDEATYTTHETDRMNRSGLQYYLCPIFSALIYVSMGYDGQIRASVIGYAASYLPYLWMLLKLRREPEIKLSQSLLLISVGISSCALMSMEPVLSEDVWRYVWDGFVTSSGVNPYCYPPESSHLDAFSQNNNLDVTRSLIGHSELPTIYPPLAQFIFSFSSLFTPSSLPIRCLGALALLLCTRLLFRLLQGREVNPSLVVLFAFNPLVLIETSVSGHVDIFAIGFVLFALRLAQLGYGYLSASAVSGAILTKVIPILIIPFVFQRRWRQWLLCFVLIAAVYSLLSTGDCSPLGSLSTFSGKWRHNEGIFGVLNWMYETLLSDLEPPALMSSTLAYWLTGTDQINTTGLLATVATKFTCLSLIIGAFCWVQPRPWFNEIKVFGLFGCFFLCSPVVHPWYLIWVLPLLPFLWSARGLVGSAPLIWWSISVLVAYNARIGLLLNQRWYTPPSLLWLEYGTLLCLALLSMYLIRRDRRG